MLVLYHYVIEHCLAHREYNDNNTLMVPILMIITHYIYIYICIY